MLGKLNFKQILNLYALLICWLFFFWYIGAYPYFAWLGSYLADLVLSLLLISEWFLFEQTVYTFLTTISKSAITK